ncbi:MAG TPA: preprotein translocase subunit SecE [Symbiobacteriaceae bacterium]|jgi:preprotein translocase SecE subunit|nr:preprotein translocase subunit SecE [Symbiobacteriaceae bacterium]
MERLQTWVAATRTFFTETIGELRKVVWPSPARTVKLTGVVLGIVLVLMGFLFLLDFPLGLAMEKFVAR